MQPLSPILYIVLKAMRIGTLFMSALMVVFLAVGVYQKAGTEGFSALTRQDYSFFGVLVFLGLGSLWLSQAINKEMKKPGA